jgi:hypothetical protein
VDVEENVMSTTCLWLRVAISIQIWLGDQCGLVLHTHPHVLLEEVDEVLNLVLF